MKNKTLLLCYSTLAILLKVSLVQAQELTNTTLKVSATPRFYINYNQDIKQNLKSTTQQLAFNRIISIDSINVINLSSDTMLINHHDIDITSKYNLSAGIMLDFVITNSSILSFGFSYRTMKYNIDESRISEIKIRMPNETNFFFTTIISDFSPKVISFRTQHISIPLTFRSKLSNKFGLLGGITGNFLLHAKNELEEKNINSSFNNNIVESTHLFRPSSLELSAGIYVAINKQINVELQYRHAVTNMLNSISAGSFFGLKEFKSNSIGFTISSSLSSVEERSTHKKKAAVTSM